MVVNRRDFILCRATSSGKIVEISCETLYMHIMDIQTASRVSRLKVSGENKNTWMSDEPSLYFDTGSVESLFCDLQSQVNNCKKIRLLNTSWIVNGLFRDKMETLLANFRELGGEIEIDNNVNKLSTVPN